jgi:hypothetical protein
MNMNFRGWNIKHSRENFPLPPLIDVVYEFTTPVLHAESYFPSEESNERGK